MLNIYAMGMQGWYAVTGMQRLVCNGLVCKERGTQDGVGMQRVDMQGVGM